MISLNSSLKLAKGTIIHDIIESIGQCDTFKFAFNGLSFNKKLPFRDVTKFYRTC